VMLADHQIRKAVLRHDLIQGFREGNLNPASYDLTLSDMISTIEWGVIDTTEVGEYTLDRTMVGGVGFLLEPGEFILAATNEVLSVPPTLCARVEGKSSLGRLGLAVHITAGFIDPGFHGSVTLEIANLQKNPVILHAGMRIAQVAFNYMSAPPEMPYGLKGHYQNQPKGMPIASRYKIEN
jgi:dCTP deaminase